MKLSEIKKHLETAEAVNFQLPDGTFVPASYHVTEVGVIEKNFIDCGGRVRKDRVANFQLWEGEDIEHRLKPEKLSKIIALSEKALNIEDMEVEVEYQSTTIGKYGIDFNNGNFLLTNKYTDCLAKDNCGVPENKERVSLSMLGEAKAEACCTPGGKCC
jgi:hypothetical protein